MEITEKQSKEIARFSSAQTIRRILLCMLFIPVYPVCLLALLFHGFAMVKKSKCLFVLSVLWVLAVLFLLLGIFGNVLINRDRQEFSELNNTASQISRRDAVEDGITALEEYSAEVKGYIDMLKTQRDIYMEALRGDDPDRLEIMDGVFDNIYGYISDIGGTLGVLSRGGSNNGYDEYHKGIYMTAEERYDASSGKAIYKIYTFIGLNMDYTRELPVNTYTDSRFFTGEINYWADRVIYAEEFIKSWKDEIEKYTEADLGAAQRAAEEFAAKATIQAPDFVYDLSLTVPPAIFLSIMVIAFVFNIAYAAKKTSVDKAVKTAKREYVLLYGKKRAKELVKTAEKYSKKRDAEGFISYIGACSDEYSAMLPELPFKSKKDKDKGVRLILAQSVVLDGKAHAKALKKQLKTLWKKRNHAELSRIKNEYECKFREYVETLPKEETVTECDGNSTFDGNILHWFGWKLLSGFLRFIVIRVITLGFSYEMGVCLWKKFYAKHTVIDGKRLFFDGNFLQLWGKEILDKILTVVTFTIYKFFVPFSVRSWEAKHTHVNGEYKELGGSFDGSTLLFALMRLGCVILNVITLGITIPFTVCAKERWRAKHTVYDGRRLVFDGKGAQLIGKWIQWLLLGIVTLGIYFIFAKFRMDKWVACRTHIEKGYYPAV